MIDAAEGQEYCSTTGQRMMDAYLTDGFRTVGNILHTSYSSHQQSFEEPSLLYTNQFYKKPPKHKIQAPYKIQTSRIAFNLSRQESFRCPQVGFGLVGLREFGRVKRSMENKALISTKIKALIIIDVQNEFLDPNGHFPISGYVKYTIVASLKALIPRFRAAGGHIIWVNAVYKNLTEEPAEMAAEEKGTTFVANNTWLTVATHVFHISCCEAGSWNAEPYPEIYAFADPTDIVINKFSYSAFHGTTALLDVLREKKVTDAYYCGVASGTCVLASIISTIKLLQGEVQPHAVLDCMGYRRPNTHVETLERLQKLNIPCHESTQI